MYRFTILIQTPEFRPAAGLLNLLVLLLLGGQTLQAQEYLWPTNASNFVSSSFCEFREGHYHSAIDIKTWLREGYPCFAVADGHVERIRISPFGYGKVLYLKLNDGNTAVYAHLQRFSAPLEKIIRHWQVTHHKYGLDLKLDSIQVKRGDIIAYNGRTGAGPPHLHFEIRNREGHPVNPLHFYPWYQDALAPGLKSLICIPKSRGSRINGSYLPQKFPLVRSKDGSYKVQQPIRIQGSVGLGIKGFDQAVELGNSFGFYQTIMIINSDTVFNIRYDELDFDQTEYIYTEIYYPQWIQSGEVFHKLYIEDYNRLNLYPQPQFDNGIIKMKQEPVSITIQVKDIRANTSTIKMELLPDSSADFWIQNIYRRGNWVYLTMFANQCREVFFQSGKAVTALKAVKYFEITDGQISSPDAGVKIKVNIDDSLNTLLKVKVKSLDNKSQEQILWVRADGTFSLKQEPEIHFLGGDLVLRWTRVPVFGTLQLVPPEKYFSLRKSDRNWCEVLIPGNSIAGGSYSLKYCTAFRVAWSKNIEMYNLYPGTAQTISWFDSSLIVTTSRESVLDTVLITAGSTSSTALKTVLRLASPLYQLIPLNFPIFDNFLLQITADSLPGWGKWSIYQIDHAGKISYLPSQIDTTHLILSARASSFGKFFIASDTIPPVLEIITPQNGQEYTGNPRIKLKLDDPHSGIGEEQNISLAIDGNYVIPEWDPERKEIVTICDDPLTPGAHTFTASIKDRCGNVKRKAVFFIIKAQQKK
jgi:hypothetical protein